MAYATGRSVNANRVRYALIMVIMMFTSVNINLLVTDLAEAHQTHGNSSTVYSWPLSGHNDTGWVTLEATNADPESGQSAIQDWDILFPPGAEVSNVSMEIMVDGSSGISIYEPHLFGENTGETFFDWRILIFANMLFSKEKFAKFFVCPVGHPDFSVENS